MTNFAYQNFAFGSSLGAGTHSVSLTSVDADFGHDFGGTWTGSSNAPTWGNSGGLYTLGIKLYSVQIPRYSFIIFAGFWFNIITAVTGCPDTVIFGEDVDNAGDITSSHIPSADWTRTTATESANITTTGWKTLTVTSIVNEIVNRSGWVSGNDINIGVEDTTAGSPEYLVINNPASSAYGFYAYYK